MGIKSKAKAPPVVGGAGISTLFALQGEAAGIAGLSETLTINSQSVAATYFYQAKDADLTDWTGTGGTLTAGGSGGTVGLDSPTPNALDRVAHDGGTRNWNLVTADQILDDDFVIEAVVQLSATSNSTHFTTYGASDGVLLRSVSGTTLRLFVKGAGGALNISAAGLVPGSWYHLMAFADVSGQCSLYVNSLNYTNPGITSVGTINDDNGMHIGGGLSGQSYTNQGIAHAAMWKQASWLDTHAQQAIVTQRFATICGVWSTGATIQSDSRASAGYMPKVSHVDGIRRLHYVGSGWHRYTREYDKHLRVGDGVLCEPAATNLCLQSQTLDTTWTKIDAGDTVDETNAAAPDGTTTQNLITGDATNGEHGVSQSITLTAAAHTMSCYAEAGTAGWLYLDVSTIADVSAYFDLGAGIVGTVGSAATAHMEYLGDNQYRCELRYTGTAAAHTHRVVMAEGDGNKDTASKTLRVWGVQIEASGWATSYAPTTSGTVTRLADDATLIYDMTGADLTQGTIASDVLLPDVDTALVVPATLHDGTDTERIYQQIVAAGDAAGVKVSDGGADQADIIGTTDVSDGRWRELRATWATVNDFESYVDGVSEGTPDVSGTVPTVDTLTVGAYRTAGFALGGIVKTRIYSQPTATKSVTDFGEIMARAGIYVSTAGSGVELNSTTYTGMTGGTPTAVVWTSITLTDFTLASATGILTYTGTDTKWFNISCGVSSSFDGGVDPVLFGILVNGTLSTPGTAGRKTPVNDMGRMAVPELLQLANSDTIQLAALADSGTPEVVPNYCTIVVVEA